MKCPFLVTNLRCPCLVIVPVDMDIHGFFKYVYIQRQEIKDRTGKLEVHVRCICSPDYFLESQWSGYLIASNPESVFEVAFISLGVNVHLSLPSCCPAISSQGGGVLILILFLYQLIISLPLSVWETIVLCHA